MSPRRGQFVTLEGTEGVGKSTALKGFVARLEAAGRAVVVTREPGGPPVAEAIRELVLAASGESPQPLTELLLMFAARAENLARIVRPALANGAWVVCDRFTDATLAYQGYGRNVELETIYALAALVHDDLWPDRTLWLDAPLEVCEARRRARGGVSDRFELEQREFFRRVREGYADLARRDPDRVRRVDASDSPEQTIERMMAAVSDLENS